MTGSIDIADKIVTFSTRVRFADLPAAAIRAARMRLIDSVGVALAAYYAPPASSRTSAPAPF